MVSDRNSPFSDLADGLVGTGQKYNAMGERELKKLCKENGLSPRGSKKDMVKRLGAYTCLPLGSVITAFDADTCC